MRPPCYTTATQVPFSTPYLVRTDTGSTATWRQTPAAGRVSARRTRSKTDATWLIPSFTLAGVMRRADAWRAAVQKLYSRRVPGPQRQRHARQGYRPGKQPIRNCSPSSGEKSPITGGFSSGGTGSRPIPRTTAAWWGIRPPRTPAESLARCRGMPSETQEKRASQPCLGHLGDISRIPRVLYAAKALSVMAILLKEHTLLNLQGGGRCRLPKLISSKEYSSLSTMRSGPSIPPCATSSGQGRDLRLPSGAGMAM